VRVVGLPGRVAIVTGAGLGLWRVGQPAWRHMLGRASGRLILTLSATFHGRLVVSWYAADPAWRAPVGNRVPREFTIPPVPEHTTPVRAGRLIVGVEYRVLDDTVMSASYIPDQMRVATDPHYHYLPNKDWQYVIAFDSHAGGDFYDFTLAALRSRLPDMLRFAGAGELADEVAGLDMNAIADEVDYAARSSGAGVH
jgi:hypothetical protein